MSYNANIGSVNQLYQFINPQLVDGALHGEADSLINSR